jgi:hypothetical protein
MWYNKGAAQEHNNMTYRQFIIGLLLIAAFSIAFKTFIWVKAIYLLMVA